MFGGVGNGYNGAWHRSAQWSGALRRFVDDGGYAIYREKSRAGLQLFGRHDVPIYRARYPERAYRDFRSIPPLVVNSLLFSEDKALLDDTEPRLNPHTAATIALLFKLTPPDGWIARPVHEALEK